MRIKFLIAIIICCIQISAKIDYNVNLIPANLKKNANAVVRINKIEYEIFNKKQTESTVTLAITILNKNGDHFANFKKYYDNFTEIDDIECTIFNADGSERREIDDDKIYDIIAFSGFASYSDGRVKYINIHESQYPFTVEYTYETENEDGFLSIGWAPCNGNKLSIEKATYSLSSPQAFKIRIKELNFPGKREEKVIDDKKVYTWNIKNFKSLRYEPFEPESWQKFPLVMIAPTDFYYDDNNGNMENWNSYGAFAYKLGLDRDVLTKDEIIEVKNLVYNISDKKEIIKTLYKFMQNSTRYVSIQYGIGGFQPAKATEVATCGYGDCKALSNYMKALLKAVNIKSYNYLILSGGKMSIYFDNFASFGQANHQMLCVPMGKDSIWLECTSQKYPFGFIGNANEDKNVLLLTEEGGIVAKTPTFQQKDNTTNKTIKGELKENGTITFDAQIKYKGGEFNDIFWTATKDKQKQEKLLYSKLPFNNFEIEKFSYSYNDEIIPTAIEKYKVSIIKYAEKVKATIILNPNLLTRRKTVPKKVRKRKTDIHLTWSYIQNDTVEIKIPKGYKPESLFEKDSINSEFGNYTCSAHFTNNTLYYYRQYKTHKGIYSSKKYKKLRKFYKNIKKRDNKVVYLIKCK